MKSIKIAYLALLFVIAISFSTSRRVKKSKRRTSAATLAYASKRKAMTRDYNGGGSWDNGFDLPGLCLANNSAGIDEDNRDGSPTLRPKNFQNNPLSESTLLGLELDFKKKDPSSEMKKFLVHKNGKKYYIPWRFFCSNFTYYNGSGYKRIYGNLCNENGDTKHLRILLPWKWAGWYINDTQGKQIANYINNFSLENKQKISTAKLALSGALHKLLTNAEVLKASESDEAAKQAKITDLNNQIDAVKSFITTKNEEILTIQSEISNLNDHLVEIENGLAAKEGEVKLKQTTKEGIEDKIEEYKSSSAEGNNLIQDLTDKVNTNLSSLEDTVGNLKALAPERASDIDSAFNSVKSDADCQAFQSSIATVKS